MLTIQRNISLLPKLRSIAPSAFPLSDYGQTRVKLGASVPQVASVSTTSPTSKPSRVPIIFKSPVSTQETSSVTLGSHPPNSNQNSALKLPNLNKVIQPPQSFPTSVPVLTTNAKDSKS